MTSDPSALERVEREIDEEDRRRRRWLVVLVAVAAITNSAYLYYFTVVLLPGPFALAVWFLNNFVLLGIALWKGRKVLDEDDGSDSLPPGPAPGR